MSEGDPISLIQKKVNHLLVENNYSANKLCEKIGMTPNGYAKMWKNRSIKVETMQKIADFFSVPLSHFFTSDTLTDGYSIEGQLNEVNEMREKYILALESENKLLKKLLNNEE